PASEASARRPAGPPGTLGSRLAAGSENHFPFRRTGVGVKTGRPLRFGVPTGSDDKIGNPGKGHVNDEVVGICHPPGRVSHLVRAVRRAEGPPQLRAHIVFGDDLAEALGVTFPARTASRSPCLRQSFQCSHTHVGPPRGPAATNVATRKGPLSRT